MSELIVGLVAAAGGLAAGLFAERAVRGRHYKTRDDIIEAARREAETLQRDQELQLKEELLKRRESLEARLEESHTKLRDRERELDRRSAQVDEQQDAFRKKEKMLQTTQQKLT
ncbi:MAG: Rnase Y domain-containing protein, partial [Planctomycetaceae bacterium]